MFNSLEKKSLYFDSIVFYIFCRNLLSCWNLSFFYFKISKKICPTSILIVSSAEPFKEILFIHFQICFFEYFQWAASKKQKRIFFPSYEWWSSTFQPLSDVIQNCEKKGFKFFVLDLSTIIYSVIISDLQSFFFDFHIFFYWIIKVSRNTELRITLRKANEQSL